MEQESLINEKLKFVSNLNGTTTDEVITVSTISAASLFLRAALLSAMPHVLLQIPACRFFLEFSTIFVPLILSVTVWSEHLAQTFYSIVMFSVFIIILVSKTCKAPCEKEVHSCYVAPPFYEDLAKGVSTDNVDQFSESEEYDTSDIKNSHSGDAIFLLPTNLPFLTAFRAFVSIATCICILAVDFHMFPRRFAKCETFGVSIMGLGVGGFVIANALVSPEARNRYRTDKPKSKTSALTSVCLQIISSWPLIALGLMRLISVKLSGYQMHVSEYGVHWNFFFTLAVVRILSSIVLAVINVHFCGLVAAVLALSYQMLLSKDSAALTTFLISDNYDGNILVQNKEGIASTFGILALYLAGIELGSFLFKPRDTFTEWKKAAVAMLAMCIAFGFALNFSSRLVQPVSRRIGNLSYSLWILYYSTMFLFQYLFVDLVTVYLVDGRLLPVQCMPNRWHRLSRKNAENDLRIIHKPEPPKPCLLSAINRNQLFYFLLCNLLTGGVNFAVNTLTVENEAALMIVMAYCIVGAILVWILHRKGVTLKFW